MSESVKIHRPKLLLVCGAWSGGTTAVAGMLAALGIKSPVPLFGTRDERTENTFESILFREAVMSVVSEELMKLTASRAEALQAMIVFRDRLLEQQQREGWLDGGKVIFLKYPLSALLIPELCHVFETRLIYVIRPLKQIEASRQRRGWQINAGEKGAAIIYSQMFHILINLPIPTHIIRYPELLANPLGHAKSLASLCGVSDEVLIQKAAKFISGHEKK